MINLTVSNSKLFERAKRIIASVARVSESLASQSLMRSIYDDNEYDVNVNVAQHIVVAAQVCL